MKADMRSLIKIKDSKRRILVVTAPNGDLLGGENGSVIVAVENCIVLCENEDAQGSKKQVIPLSDIVHIFLVEKP